MRQVMKFLSISLDPNGVYVGYDAKGQLWHYLPAYRQWVMLHSGEPDKKPDAGG